jgi:hypothetical protein
VRVPEQAGDKQIADTRTHRLAAGNRGRGARSSGRKERGRRKEVSLVLEHEPLLDGVHPSVVDHRGGHPDPSLSLSLSLVEAKASAAAARACGLRCGVCVCVCVQARAGTGGRG